MKRILILGWLLLAVALAPMAVQGQAVSLHPTPAAALTQKWTWATDQAVQTASRTGYWVGYSIQRLMHENSFIGSWSSRERRTSLHELIYGEKPEFSPDMMGKRGRDVDSERKVLKEVAVLFEYEPGASEPSQICITNLSGHIDLAGRTLYWLGGAGDAESLSFVKQQYDRTRATDLKEDLVMALAIHEQKPQVIAILSGILSGQEDDEVREKAAFWLGQQDDKQALDLLVRTARNDRSTEVRKQAVFGVSQTELPEATEALIDLARNEQGEVGKQAIFWLGQRASKKAVEALGDIVDNSDDTELQKQAVFALSQLPNEEAVPLLVKIAKTHKSAKVRKQAIFWLGQSDDPRALDALIELVRS